MLIQLIYDYCFELLLILELERVFVNILENSIIKTGFSENKNKPNPNSFFKIGWLGP